MERLQELVGCYFLKEYRILNLIGLDFSRSIDDADCLGLHIQCMMRITKGSRILACSNDMYAPAEEMDAEVFRWDEDRSRFDADMERIMEECPHRRVTEVSVAPNGDLKLVCDDGSCISAIISSTDEEEEMWRFMPASEDAPHLICCAHTFVESEMIPED